MGGGGDQLPPTSLRVNPIFNPMKCSKFIRLITFDPGLFILLSWKLQWGSELIKYSIIGLSTIQKISLIISLSLYNT